MKFTVFPISLLAFIPVRKLFLPTMVPPLKSPVRDYIHTEFSRFRLTKNYWVLIPQSLAILIIASSQ